MNKNRKYNFLVYVDGMGFLEENADPTHQLFVSTIDNARTYKRKEAEKVCLLLCDEYKDVWVVKKCSDFQSSKNM